MRTRHRVTAPLVLTRILSRLWGEGGLKDVSYLEEAYFPDDGTVNVKAYSNFTGGLEWRMVHWDEDWNIAG